MKKLKKISVFCLALTVLFATGCGCDKKETKKEKESKPIVNTNENVVKDQEINGLTFTNTSLVYKNGISTLVTEITNNTGADYPLGYFDIIAKDEDGKQIIKMKGYVGDVIPAGETKTVNAATDADLSKAVSIEYAEVIK